MTVDPDSTRESRPDGRDDLDLFLAVWRQRRLILLVTVLSGLIGVAYALLATPLYTATVTILPGSDDRSGDVFGQLASMTGGLLNLSGGGQEMFFGRIVKSEQVLGELIGRKWHDSDFAGDVSLYEIFGVDNSASPTVQAARNKLLDKLRSGVIAFNRDDETGFMTLSATVPRDPAFARDFANALVDGLSTFNKQHRMAKAQEKREFIEKRLASVESGLNDAEQELAEFVNENRTFESAPMLRLEYERMQRAVAADATVWESSRSNWNWHESMSTTRWRPSMCSTARLNRPPARRRAAS